MKNKTDSQQDLASILDKARQSKSSRRWIYLILVVCLGAGAFFWLQARGNRKEPGPVFSTQPVKRGTVAFKITTTGTLEPVNEVTIGSEVSGTVTEVYVDINDHVTKGQQLAKLDTTKLAQQTEQSRAALRAAKAMVSQNQASVKEAKANLARLKELHRISNGRSPSQAELNAADASVDRAMADLESAEAQVSQSTAQLKSNESDLGKGVLQSPVDGVVLTRSIEPGQTVAAQFQAPELFVIAEDLATMKLVVAVAEADIGRVASGQKASFTVDAWPKRTYDAEVKKVSFGSEITDNLVTYETELNVENKDLSLRPGMTAIASIAVMESADVLLVPNAALRFDPKRSIADGGNAPPKKSLMQSLTPGPPRRAGGGFPGGKADEGKGENKQENVWVLRDGQPVPIPIETGITDGKNTEITSPELKAGDEVIVSAFSPEKP